MGKNWPLQRGQGNLEKNDGRDEGKNGEEI
jgi:hypothetical protein